MAEPQFGDPDDLPRTLRRERDAREAARQAQATQGSPHATAGYADQSLSQGLPHDYPGLGDVNGGYGFVTGGTVTRIEVPFFHLVRFFIKAVLAAIPALILLTLLLFAGGKVLQAFFPGLRLFEIVVRTPQAQPPASATPDAGKGPTVQPITPTKK